MLFCTIIFILSESCLGANISENIHSLKKVQNILLQEAIIESLINPVMTTHESRATLKGIFQPVLVTEENINFFLFTRNITSNNGFLLTLNLENLKLSNFSANRPTKIIVHGWTDSSSTFWVEEMRKSYLKIGDYNVICVNWYPESAKEYLIAAKLTQQIGKLLANMLKFLENEINLSLSDVHILGHSLGAHIAGFAGKNLLGKVGRITGMDPARPYFETQVIRDTKYHLIRTDAIFVDIIHTCAGTIGFVEPIGHADFYPNGGTATQPGCSILLAQSCSHARSYLFIMESMQRPSAFPSIACDTWKNFKLGRCRKNSLVSMGENVDYNTRGIFYLETNSASPFGKSTINFIFNH